jgi:hypothetical protein
MAVLLPVGLRCRFRSRNLCLLRSRSRGRLPQGSGSLHCSSLCPGCVCGLNWFVPGRLELAYSFGNGTHFDPPPLCSRCLMRSRYLSVQFAKLNRHFAIKHDESLICIRVSSALLLDGMPCGSSVGRSRRRSSQWMGWSCFQRSACTRRPLSGFVSRVRRSPYRY